MPKHEDLSSDTHHTHKKDRSETYEKTIVEDKILTQLIERGEIELVLN